MKRKSFLLGALILPAITACSSMTETTAKTDSSTEETPLDNIIQSSISENNSLVFGDSDDSRKMTFILNLGNDEILSFLLSNLPSIQQKFNNNESFEILLVDLPSSTPTLSTSDNLTYILSSVAMYAYVESQELFIDFLQTAVSRWSEQATFVREDVVYLAQELELLPNLDITGTNSISRSFVEKMTEKALKFTESSPAILIDDSLWTGNINNPIEIEQLFNPPAQ